MGSLSLLQVSFLTQESNLGLLRCRQILYQLSDPGSPLYHWILSWLIRSSATSNLMIVSPIVLLISDATGFILRHIFCLLISFMSLLNVDHMEYSYRVSTPLSANSNICVSFGLVSVDRVFSFWIMLSCLFTSLIISDWILDIVNFTLFGAGIVSDAIFIFP